MSSSRPVVGAVVVIAAVIVGLTAIDKSLASIESSELRGSAERAYQEGIDLARRGMPAPALDLLRQAHATERDSPEYTLALIETLTALNKTAEAEQLSADLLATHPNHGEANLVTARLMRRESKFEEAEAYYHRAIYGTWQTDLMGNRRAARLELVHMLVDENARQRLLAELISLSSEAGDDEALKQQIAHLYLVAGSPARAVAMYREIVDRKPHNAQVLEAMGEAELQSGEYRAARSAFQQASFYDPSAKVQPRLQLLTEVTALDPTPRRLTSGEKYTRSLRILELAKGDLESRMGSAGQATAPADAASLLKQASADLAKKTPRNVNNEMAEQELDLGERIWKIRLKMFGPSTSADEEPLRLIMERLAT